MTDSSTPSHPTDETVAAYLEGVLPPSDRSALEKHIGECDYCRARLVLAGRAIETAPRPRAQVRWRPVLVLALAASLAGVLLLSRPADPPLTPSPVRGAEQEVTQSAVRIVAPLRGTRVDPATLQFIWSSLEPNALYQVTLSAADGKMLWTTRTADTMAVPPRDVRQELQPGQPYFWRVDALLTSLRSVTSSEQLFRVSPR